MPPYRPRPMFYLVLLSCFCCVLGGAAASAGDAGPRDASTVRVWVRPLAYEDSPHAEARFQLEEVVSPGALLDIPCNVSISAELTNPRILLCIFDKEDELLFEGVNPLDEIEGSFDSVFQWPLEGVDDGMYTARLTVVHGIDRTLAWREVLLEKYTYERIVWHCASLAESIKAVEESIQRVPENACPDYCRFRAAIASDALRTAEKLLRDGNWPLASAVAEYGHFLANSARAVLTFGPVVPEIGAPVPVSAPTDLEVRDGALLSSGKPVFLFGLHDPAMNVRLLTTLERYGLNFASIEVPPEDLLLETGVNDEVASRTGKYLAKAGKLGIGVTVGLRTETAPEWLANDTPTPETVHDDVDRLHTVDPRQARIIGRRQLEAMASCLAKYPSVNGVSLAFEPRFHWESETVRRGFIEAIARKYNGDRRAVNRIWRTRLRSLDEIEILWDYDRASYQYDWQTWHQHIVSKHFEWLAGHAEQALPGIPKQITLPNTVFEPGEARTGIDREALAGMTGVTACTATYEARGEVYAFAFPSPDISYRLLRSLAPDNPIVVLDATFDLADVPAGAATSRYLHTAMWEAAIAGVNGCALAPGNIWQSPGAMEGFATACFDVNRLGNIVTAFQRAEAPIAILWSMPSRIYRDGEIFLNSVKRVYEGCASFGFPIRFITESECTPAGLEDVAVLILPEVPALADETFEAINNYATAGGTVIRSGRPAPYTPTGASRHEVITQTDRTIFMRASDTPTVFLHALDAAYVFGILPPIPRTINNYGYPLEGVKSRYVQYDGQEYLYVTNLRPEPVKADLFGGTREGRDLIRGRNVRFPLTLAPLDPMLVRLGPLPSPSGNQKELVRMAGEGHEAEDALEAGPVVLEPVTP